jgi:uncharacterized membrane protein
MRGKRWFKAKKYGWGWTPASWEGWLCLALLIVFVIWNFFRIDDVSNSARDVLHGFIFESLLAALLLVIVCFIKGEKPGTGWHDKNN